MRRAPLIINEIAYPYTAVQSRIPLCNLLEWVMQQPSYPKVYWQSPHQPPRAALGHLLHFDRVPVVDPASASHVHCFGSCSFEGQAHFWLPALEIEGLEMCAHDIGNAPKHTPLPPPWEPHAQNLALSKDKWLAMATQTIASLEAGHLQKVVLSHRAYAPWQDPVQWLQARCSIYPSNTHFLFAWAPDQIWVGSSPERLYHRQGDCLITDALAGTSPTGETLLTDPKLSREFAYVKSYIEETLSPFCSELGWLPADTVRVLKNIHHRYNRCTATLQEGITDRTLIDALHPTPALGGFPRQDALRWIAQHEPTSRGSFGAPIGFLSSQAAEIVVAIRSCLIRPNQIECPAGAGLVAGSIPEKEWDEIQLKISTLR